MHALGTEQFTFATIADWTVEGRAGLTRRLVFTLQLDLLQQLWDDNDPERLLHAMQLVAIDGDCWLESGTELTLVAGLRLLTPGLPLAQGREPRRVTLALGADLSPELAQALLALAPEAPRFRLELRGLCEVWANPLYDHDGYQTTRVGDSGLSRAIQHIGARSLVPLHDSDQRVILPAAQWAQVRGALA